LPQQIGGDLERQSGLADAARAGEREQSLLRLTEEIPRRCELALAADEGSRLDGEIVWEALDRPERRGAPPPTPRYPVDHAPRPLQVAKPVVAEVAQFGPNRQRLPDQVGGCRREQHLPAVRGIAESPAAIERSAEVVVALPLDLAGVETHPHSERPDLAP